MSLQEDACNRLAGTHVLLKRATMSDQNLASFPEDESVPQAIKRSFMTTSDPYKSREKSRSTNVSDREAEEPVTCDDATAENDHGVVIDYVGVIPTGDDMSAEGCPDRMKALGASLTPSRASLADRTEATDVAKAGRPPQPTKNCHSPFWQNGGGFQ